MFVIALLLNIPIPAQKILVGRAYIKLKVVSSEALYLNEFSPKEDRVDIVDMSLMFIEENRCVKEKEDSFI